PSPIPPAPPPRPPRPPPPFTQLYDRTKSPPPSAPPLGADKFSRLLYKELDEDTAAILAQNAEATGWLAVSSRVSESIQGFPDTTLFEGAWLQSESCDDKRHVVLGQLAENSTQEARANCIYCTKQTARELFYRNTECERVSTEEDELIMPTDFLPRCLVALVAAESERDLFDQMLANGRRLTDPARFNVSFVTATHVPDAEINYKVASIHTAISMLLQAQYAADLVGQESLDALFAAEQALETKKTQVDLFERTVKGLSQYVDRKAGEPTPADFLARLADMKAEQQALQDNLDRLRAEAQADCTPSLENTCGRALFAAPDPWTAANGEACIGKSTHEAFPGAFCARWNSVNNVDAAEAEEAHELLVRLSSPITS
ncbi:MAG: hypothetical protein VXA08_09645, partial [Alphaproteobacteria bacterium]